MVDDGIGTGIYVACPISNDDIRITSYPMVVDGLITIPFFRNFSLDIFLDAGSFPFYNVSWGDSLFDTFDGSQEKTPQNVSLLHRYQEPSDDHFLIEITVCNQFSCGEKKAPMKVSKCGPPLLRISKEPIILKRDKLSDIILEWSNGYPECASVDKSDYFGYHVSKISLDNESFIEKIKWRVEYSSNRLLLQIPPYTLKDGKFLMILDMRSSITFDEYALELSVLPATIKANILGGGRRVEQKMDYEGEQMVFKNLIFNASHIEDFDEDKDSSTDLDGFTYQWFCRTHIPSPLIARQNNSNANRICSGDTWTLLKYVEPVISVSTENLVSKQEYEFKVNVSKKGHLSGKAMQKVKISSSKLPKGVTIM